MSSLPLRLTHLPLSLVAPLCLTAALPALSGCSAHDPSSEFHQEGGREGRSGEETKGLPGSCTVASGSGVLRRLTTAEYRASLIELLGREDFPAAEPLTSNTAEGAYSTRASGLWVKDLTAQAIENHASAIGEWVAATDPGMVTSCTDFSEQCGAETVARLGRRAFRMPMTPELGSRYLSVFLAGDTFEEGLSLVVSAMIQSPYFLYRRELGTGAGDTAALSDHELGSALAFFLTDSPPDAELSTLIDAGQLRDEGQWQRQVDRLLNSPEAEEKLIGFVIEWLGLDEAKTRTKTEDNFDVPESLRESMMQEVEALVRHVVQTDGGLSDLLANESVFVNAELAMHYGLPAPGGDSFVGVSAGERAGGLLGTGAYLLAHSSVDSSSPTLRGIFIRERILCHEIEPPPPTVDTDLPPVSGAITTRQRYAQHLASEGCRQCHAKIDTLGFAFEAFDGLGRYRTEEHGIAVDTTGVTVGLDSGEQAFNGAHELTNLLAADEQVDRCFHKNLTEFVVGQPDWDDLCSVEEVAVTALASGGSLRDSLRAIFTLPHLESRVAQGAL